MKEVIDENTFTVSDDIDENDTIFLYGIEVNDFKVIEHDQLLSVAINTIKKQKTLIDDLTARIIAIEAKLSN